MTRMDWVWHEARRIADRHPDWSFDACLTQAEDAWEEHTGANQ